MFTRACTILKVLANEATSELDTENDAAFLLKESVTKLFENVLVILVRCDIICTNEEIKKIQMDKIIVDQGCSGKWGNEC
jgi:hypothetical protein